MSMKKMMLSIFALLTIIVLAACGANGNEEPAATEDDTGAETTENVGDTQTFRVSHVVQESHVWHKIAEKFDEELQAMSDGRMNLEIYSGSQLGLEQDMVQQLETGSLDFGFLTNAYMSTREVSLNSWFMPFLFNDIESAIEMRESQTAQDMLASLESQGLIGLDFAFAGNRHILMQDGFVESLDDLSGKAVRIIGSPSIQSFWEKTPAGPTSMPLTEVYTSLQTGVIDGMDIDLDALVTEKYYENAEYLTLTNHATFPTVIVMSGEVYNSLSAEDQGIVEDALTNAVEWGLEEVVKREEENLQTLIDIGVQVQEFEDISSFESTIEEVKEEFSSESDIVKSFIEAVEQ